MNKIIKHSLLASIQTLRSILLGMETMLTIASSDEEKQKSNYKQIEIDYNHELDENETEELSKILGVKKDSEVINE
jgi:hypothetical protein